MSATAALNVQAAVLFDNLGQDLATWAPTSDGAMAQHFTTDSQAYSLNSATLSMLRTSGSGGAIVEIWSGNTSIPTALLSTLTAPGSYASTKPANTVFTTAGVALNADSSYWVVLKSSNADSVFGWCFTTSNTGSGVGFSSNWATSSDGGDVWDHTDTESPYQMRLDVTPVPEASTSYVLIGLGLVVIGHARKRIFRRQS